ncbi:sensor histidine kinase [Nodosilinea sp. PGN35]|uniref:sensor histidine kinase n=1 Tax=Nodosilinea sp. PGN35 TaxID=3020489 RepID=UPI0023B33F3E|nr:HAMP domain-containing sensor histidine kinase [Nodosilinea sp. TSF1-S3]MDF0366718.1 HAMP domain-containing sensor histidine kinase [Nodosilinea sp. TSF1-S3]
MFTRSRKHLTQWLMLTMGSVFVVFGGLLYVVEVDRELHKLDQQLYREAELMISSSGADSSPNPTYPVQFEVKTLPLLGGKTLSITSDLVYARWYDTNNHLLMFFGPLSGDRRDIQPGYTTLVHEGQRLRQMTVPIESEGQTLGHLELATALVPVETALNQIRLVLSVGLPVGVGLIGLLSWWFAGQVMRPIQLSYQRLEQFSADASHELRSPVASILSQAELGLMTASPQEQVARLQRIAELAQSMGRLINSLLLLVSSDRWSGNQRCNLTALIKDLSREFQPQAAAKGLWWRLELPQAALWVNGETELLRQAITNLLSNACRYTTTGEVALSLSHRLGQVIVTVHDSGIGIPAADLPHVFDRFYRVDKARSRHTGGFGLGLAIAQQIVQAHHGTLQVVSTENQGSTFTISLPLLPPALAQPQPASPQTSAYKTSS